ncbi:MAG: OmpA family protein [Myxococcota bacterium]
MVGGYTDTLGNAELNKQLSGERVRALARSLRERGLNVPVFYAGFGEKHMAVKTEDEVDESRNRRARYILAVMSPETGDWYAL